MNIRFITTGIGNLTGVFPQKSTANVAEKTTEKSSSYITELILDSKSIANKLHAMKKLNPSNIASYSRFEELLCDDVERKVLSLKEKVLDKVNPINSSNIDEIKVKMLALLKRIDPKDEMTFAEPINEVKDPLELFYNLKTFFIQAYGEYSGTKFVNQSKKFFENENQDAFNNLYRQFRSSGARTVREFMQILALKSTNPKVIKLEEDVKNLGVKYVNFSDDIKQARKIKSAVKDLVKAKIPLPTSINVTPACVAAGFNVNGVSNLKKTGHVHVLTSKQQFVQDNAKKIYERITKNSILFKNATADFQERFMENLNATFEKKYSSKNPKHIIYHEVGHSFQPCTYDVEALQLSSKDMEVAATVSKYATSLENGREALAEMFAKLMDRQKLTTEQMDLYLRLGGIVPRFD